MDVVTQNLAVTLGSTLAKTLSSLSACRQDASVECAMGVKRALQALLAVQADQEADRVNSRPVMMYEVSGSRRVVYVLCG